MTVKIYRGFTITVSRDTETREIDYVIVRPSDQWVLSEDYDFESVVDAWDECKAIVDDYWEDPEGYGDPEMEDK